MGTTFSARWSADYLCRRVQSRDSGGPSKLMGERLVETGEPQAGRHEADRVVLYPRRVCSSVFVLPDDNLPRLRVTTSFIAASARYSPGLRRVDKGMNLEAMLVWGLRSTSRSDICECNLSSDNWKGCYPGTIHRAENLHLNNRCRPAR
jgi:hypothetical protein